MRKARKQLIYALKFFDTLVAPISEYGVELWGFKGLKKLEKTNLPFYFRRETVDSKQFCLWGVGKRPCQFRFRWKQLKLWNRLN